MLNLVRATKRELLEDRALASRVAAPNIDPLDVMIERETAAERLAEYLDHVALSARINVATTSRARKVS